MAAEEMARKAKSKPEPKQPTVDEIMDYESGQMDQEQVVSFFQRLIDSGLAWSLQGHYGRTAEVLIEHGHCHRA
jgi:hypothetical protein